MTFRIRHNATGDKYADYVFIRCSGNVPDIFGAFAVNFIPF